MVSSVFCKNLRFSAIICGFLLVAHDCGYPLSRYTCRATRVAADFLDFIAFCRCSTGVALHPLKVWCRTFPPPPFPGGVAPTLGSEEVSRYTGVSQLQSRVSRYTVQLRVSCALQMLESPGEGVNLRKSAVFCENLRLGPSLSPKGPRHTKNTTRSKFTTRTIFSTAGWFTIAAHLVRTPLPWELQTFFPSKKGPRRTKFGGRSKNTTP